MQLLKITTTPIEYSYDIKHPRLEMKHAPNAKPIYNVERSRLQIDSSNIKVKIDSTAAYESLGLKNTESWAKDFRQKGIQAAREATANYAQMGNELANIADGVTIAEVSRSRMLKQPTTYTVFLPSTGPDLSWESPTLDIDYTPGSMTTDWDIQNMKFNYVAGDFSLNITQYPKVNIEYLGGFNYVPPSSDPNYEAVA